MIEIEGAHVRKLIMHKLDLSESGLLLSNSLINIGSEESESIIKKIFLKPFLSCATSYEFHNEIDIELNTLFTLSRAIYNDEDFITKSKAIGQHLAAVSKHPNIKNGDLFVIKFDDLKINDGYCEALGIYKIENKENFIETESNSSGDVRLSFRKGIGNKRLDKACLIVFSNEPYAISIIDNVSSETDYWQNEFIKVRLKNDNMNSTNQFLSLTKSYVTEQLPNEFEVNRADQIDLLNRSVNYFKTHETFNKNEFENDVLQDSAIIKSFRDFNNDFRAKNEVGFADDFEISSLAVKKQAKIFKSVLKLDKNFHIYIHGNRDLIEQGVEKDGRKYYKIYYKEEG